MALSDSCFVRPGEAWRLQRQGLGWNQVELHGRCLHPDTPGLVWGQDSVSTVAAALIVLDFSVSVVVLL